VTPFEAVMCGIGMLVTAYSFGILLDQIPVDWTSPERVASRIVSAYKFFWKIRHRREVQGSSASTTH
jgi:hypothetical protein